MPSISSIVEKNVREVAIWLLTDYYYRMGGISYDAAFRNAERDVDIVINRRMCPKEFNSQKECLSH